MPVLGIVMGAVGVASGAAALAGGTALLSMAGLAAGASIVGGAMAVIGGVTGNQKMTQNGALIGGIGAIGGLATGTLGDPSKVFSGGGTLNTRGGILSGSGSGIGNTASASSIMPDANAVGGAISGNVDSALSSIGSIAGKSPNVINLANSAKTIGGAANTIAQTSTGAGSLLDSINRYENLGKAVVGAVDYFGNQQKLNQEQQQFQTKQAMLQQQLNSGAGTVLPIAPIANNGGLLYQGVTQRPTMVNGSNMSVAGVK